MTAIPPAARRARKLVSFSVLFVRSILPLKNRILPAEVLKAPPNLLSPPSSILFAMERARLALETFLVSTVVTRNASASALAYFPRGRLADKSLALFAFIRALFNLS